MFFKKTRAETAPASTIEPPDAATAAPPADAAQGKPVLSAEEIKKRGAAAKHVAASFGEIVTLMMRSAADTSITLRDLEWMVVPALQTGQFAVADAQSKETGAVMPVAGVLWAFVSDEIDQKLSSNLDQPIKLKPADWRSGKNAWIVMAIGESKILGGLLQQLSREVFAGQPPKMRARGADGKIAVGRLEFSAPAAS